VEKLLRHTELPPRNFREDFGIVFEGFESTHNGRAKTAIEYMLVTEAAKLALAHLESGMLINQQRPAVESLFRKTHEGAALQGAEPTIRIDAMECASKYLTDSALRFEADKALRRLVTRRF
jgi:hypothetical protein